ncbi:MAG: cytochrome c oxidase assembly protein [Candidatus Rokuibacteriota bacterium]|nr:MAG: cytochrome c oxidase assembly protein [Candidatus Rokubacteria bacterium]
MYIGGWTQASSQMPERFAPRHLAAFLAGLTAVAVALISPLDALARNLLVAHMGQHILLMLVAPPLLWLGAPVAPLLLGLPRPIRRAVAMGLAVTSVRRLIEVGGHPVVSWLSFSLAFWVWHVPALYDLALNSDAWHHAEHACFFATALCFWRPVILAWPARSVWPRWAMIPYLVLAEAQNTALAAILTFSDRVIYPAYAAAPRVWDLTALEDQAIAGVLMWVPGSFAFLLPTIWLIVQSLSPARPARLGSHAPLTPGRPRTYI